MRYEWSGWWRKRGRVRRTVVVRESCRYGFLFILFPILVSLPFRSPSGSLRGANGKRRGCEGNGYLASLGIKIRPTDISFSKNTLLLWNPCFHCRLGRPTVVTSSVHFSSPGGLVPRAGKKGECWTFLDWRLNSENDSPVHGKPSLYSM